MVNPKPPLVAVVAAHRMAEQATMLSTTSIAPALASAWARCARPMCRSVMPAECRGGRLVAALEAAVSLPPRLIGCFWGRPLDRSGNRPREASEAGLGGVTLSDGNSGRLHASVRGLRKAWATGVKPWQRQRAPQQPFG